MCHVNVNNRVQNPNLKVIDYAEILMQTKLNYFYEIVIFQRNFIVLNIN